MGRRVAVVGVLGALFVGGQTSSVSAAQGLRIEAVSNRADLVSGGDVLVRIALPGSVANHRPQVRVGKRDVSGAFSLLSPGRFEGMITGLRVGRSVLTATDGGVGARLVIIDHPIGGPVFSGAPLQPWPCEVGAIDAQCDKPTTYAYEYMSSSPNGGFEPYDPANPPSDVATTTTQSGKTVPFVVRIETGFEDRDEYQIAVLYDPKQPWSPLSPQAAWNGKAVVTQGAGCGSHHGAEGSGGAGGVENLDAIPSVLDSEALGLGFAVMAPALDNSSHSCNVALQSESVMMLKEHFVEAYGPLRYTIAQGCSGGSLSQLQDANAYPGLYQGLLPSCTFPDAWSSAMDAEDCNLLESYFEDPSRWGAGVAWSQDQMMAAEGKISPSICHAWREVFPFYQSIMPGRPSPVETKAGELDLQNCGLSDAQLFASATNPHGVRCSLQDAAVAIFGRRTQDGYAQRPLSNVGVQYGLRALAAGTITPAQFVDLNEKVGSHDINYVWQPGRVGADVDAVKAAYRSGAVNETNNLAGVAIIDEAAGNTDIHEEYRAFAISARLDRETGGHANHVIWYGIEATFPDPLKAMDAWLAAVAADHAKGTRAQKVARDKPADVHDICDIAGADDAPDQATCQRVAGFGTGTRGAAGSPLATDNIDCQLKPLLKSDYYPIQFTDQQWSELEKLFPNGVCDWSKPGIGQRPNVPWQTYTGGPGGRALGPPPRSVPLAKAR